jgi:short subunit dehydrogenase-like uncharacterized protein
VAAALAAEDLGDLRLGARRPRALPAWRERPGPAVELAEVDFEPDALARFCSGCRVVVNCVGPPPELRRAVTTAAHVAGADVVDPGGDDGSRQDLAGSFPTGTAVVGAGVLPGLSGLIPRWLARGDLEPPLSLTAYVATADRMTRASAVEFLLSLDGRYGESGAGWRAGARIPHDLPPLGSTRLPFFPLPVVGHAYLSDEIEQVARSVPLAEVCWYHVFEATGSVLPAIVRLQRELRRGEPLDDLAEELRRAVELEMFGRAPMQQLVFELSGRVAGRPAHRVAVLRASSTYDLTATVIAAAVRAILRDPLPPGVHYAAQVLDPAVVAGLPAATGVVGLHVLDRPLVDYVELDQGAI